MVKLAGLLPGESVVLGLRPVEDEVGDDEGRNHCEEGAPDPPQGVGQTHREDPSEGLLLVGGEVVLGGAADLHPEGAESEGLSDQGSPHGCAVS